MSERPDDRVENQVEILADVFGEEAEHEVAVLLKELVLPSISTVGGLVAEMLAAVEFHGDVRVRAEQVDLQARPFIERERKPVVDREAAAGFR